MAATPKTITDASSDLDEANLNLFVRGGKLQVKVNYCVIKFEAAGNAVTVYAARDSDGEIVDGDLSWNAGSVQVEIVLSGFSAAPVGQATIRAPGNASTNVEKVQIDTTSSTAAILHFMSSATPGAKVDPDGDMYVNVLFIGA